MAITKIHPIKSTLKKAIDYIADPAKTDDKLLVSSFGCAVETADLEFEKTRLLAMQKGNNLAHHLIQAFERVRSAMRKPTRSGGSLPMKSSAASMSMSLLLTSTRSIAITIPISVLWNRKLARSTFPTAKAMRRSAMSAIGCAGKTGCPLSRPARSAVSNTPNGTRSGKGQAISKS